MREKEEHIYKRLHLFCLLSLMLLHIKRTLLGRRWVQKEEKDENTFFDAQHRIFDLVYLCEHYQQHRYLHFELSRVIVLCFSSFMWQFIFQRFLTQLYIIIWSIFMIESKSVLEQQWHCWEEDWSEQMISSFIKRWC